MQLSSAGAAPVSSFAYQRDAVGNPLVIRERDDRVYYGYDGAYRLTQDIRMAWVETLGIRKGEKFRARPNTVRHAAC